MHLMRAVFCNSSLSNFVVPLAAINTYGNCKFSTFKECQQKQQSCKVLVVGGGAGGCAQAAKLSAKFGQNNVIILEPSDRHYYQPMFTLVGGGMKTLENTFKPMAAVLPCNAKWLQDKATEFQPANNLVISSKGYQIKYDILVLAMGLQLNYKQIPGLTEALSIPNGKVCSIYSPKYVENVFQCMRNIEEGNAIFTFPSSAVKCPGAPQKIVYISEHFFRKLGKRQRINITYNTALPVLFGVKHYADALWKVVKKRNITVNTRRNLIEVQSDADVAIFQDLDDPSQTYEEKYGMLHVVPPMNAPTQLRNCKELVNEAGFVNVDNSTLQHVNYPNIFSIGDCSGTPNSKTAASAAAQTPVVYNNILAVLEGKPLETSYNGYASCPLVTGYNSCILAEFDYNLTPLETFPVEQNIDRYSMFVLKKHLMPKLYWQAMLKGYWNGPATMRKLMAPLKQRVNVKK